MAVVPNQSINRLSHVAQDGPVNMVVPDAVEHCIVQGLIWQCICAEVEKSQHSDYV
ncbi:hypothetical protein FOQG_18993 [Fusarium oxysporum f. sp. raphani 54005]|uniref:Uncharacterized protein n=4 Tax=Fusarium oxysporum species complex TaxID=171631 RepID=X0B2D2_FUSOX|nr:uncharacterized protein FOIG_16223 [Fusarium odoratissimum NRRL 54006]EXK76260.1 hypothetical protein FOQG_18993 [Fusarium oxysporum f. sp. raphani 54005]EXL72409.1 hypothetical protein FOPG_12061 [Fusarium oxysporum f. sp. conglutinans race 2 54008]EXL90539.1 hypothetical protein FOIG_16223 [Fusarium odoratissimum NRRL 54006]TXB96037.1 hypothetical protein FocTR4_00016819 [Fusarium oxysporum f. sp. cubense]